MEKRARYEGDVGAAGEEYNDLLRPPGIRLPGQRTVHYCVVAMSYDSQRGRAGCLPGHSVPGLPLMVGKACGIWCRKSSLLATGSAEIASCGRGAALTGRAGHPSVSGSEWATRLFSERLGIQSTVLEHEALMRGRQVSKRSHLACSPCSRALKTPLGVLDPGHEQSHRESPNNLL